MGRGSNANSSELTAVNATSTHSKTDQRQKTTNSTARKKGKRTLPFNPGNLLAFARTPGKIQILHIDLWYAEGPPDEINITSPHVSLTEDLERQYIYMKGYLQKAAPDLGIVAYQASLCWVNPDGTLKKFGIYAKVDCSTIPTLKPGQYYENE